MEASWLFSFQWFSSLEPDFWDLLPSLSENEKERRKSREKVQHRVRSILCTVTSYLEHGSCKLLAFGYLREIAQLVLSSRECYCIGTTGTGESYKTPLCVFVALQ